MSDTEQQAAHHHLAALDTFRQGDLRAAHQHCLEVLQVDPNHADAWFLCGVIAAHNGLKEKSLEILRNAVRLAPDKAEYRAELGKQLLASRQPEAALSEAEHALSLQPQEATTLNTLGTLLSHTGEHKKALHCFVRAARLLRKTSADAAPLPAPWQADLYFNLATSLQFGGDFNAAEEAYERAIKRQPLFFKAHSALSQLRRQTPDNNHLDRLHSLRDKVDSARDQLQLGHAIAKEQEDLGHYQDALGSLAWGKRAQAQQVNYDPDADRVLMKKIQQLFTADILNTPGALACDSPEPIFIVGMPRTGTTLVEQILSSHSQVFAAGELQNFPLLVKRMIASSTEEILDLETLTQSLQLDFAALGSDYIDSTRPRTAQSAHFIDKLPLNFMYLGLIRRALPRAKLVCLRRDPMDTCLSNYRQLFATNYRYYHYSYDLLDCGRYYIQFDRLMRHWQDAMPGAIYEVEYEALVDDPEAISRNLLLHCDLPWEEQCLDFHQSNSSVATPSAVQVRQEIYSTSVKRWEKYGEAMQPLYSLLRDAGLYD